MTSAPAVAPRQQGHDREAWVGLFVIAGIAAVLVALFTLTDAAMFRGRYVVTTRVPDAGGIRRGDPVQMRGVNIGRVQRFKMVPEGVAIRLEIEGEYLIPEDSRVELHALGLLGGTVANVIPGTSAKSLKRGDNLPGAQEANVANTATDLAGRANDVLDRARQLLSEKTIGNVESSGVQLRQLLKDLSGLVANQKTELSGLTQSLRRSADGIERASTRPELERAIARLDSLTERTDAAAASIERSSKSLETVLSRLEKGQGTLGRLSTDPSLYENVNEAAMNLNQAAQELTRLTADIRRQPKRYLKLSLF